MLLAHTVVSNLLFPLYAILCSLFVHDSLTLLEKLMYEEFCRGKNDLKGRYLQSVIDTNKF